PMGLAAAAAATRAEALVLLPILALEMSRLRAARASATARREGLVAFGVGVACLLPYFIFNLAHARSPFPTAFAAKARDPGLLYALHDLDVREFLVSLSVYPYIWATFAMAFFGRMNIALPLLAPLGAWVAARGPRRAWAPGLVLIALPVLRGIAA